MLPFSSPSHAPTLSKPAVAGKLPQSAYRGEKTNQRRHLSSDFPADHHHLRPPHEVRLVALAAGYKFRPNLTPSTLAVTGKASEVLAIPTIEAAIITLFWPIGTVSLCRSGPTHLVMFCPSGHSPGPTVAAIAIASADKLLRCTPYIRVCRTRLGRPRLLPRPDPATDLLSPSSPLLQSASCDCVRHPTPDPP